MPLYFGELKVSLKYSREMITWLDLCITDLLNQCTLGTEVKNDGGVMIEGSNTIIFQMPTSQEQDETGYICSKFRYLFVLT